MSKLKPQFIITGSNKEKSGFTSGIGHFFLLVLVFVLGVYVGMRVDNTDLVEESSSGNAKDSVPATQDISGEAEKVVTKGAQEKGANINIQDTSPQKVSESYQDKIEDANLEISPADTNTKLVDDASIVKGSDVPTENLDNELVLVEGGSVASGLFLQDSYRLQVAAFGNLDDANELVSELELKGYDAYIVTTPNSRGEVWNLIKIGNFQTAREAWNFSTMYQNKEGGEVFVESLNRGRVYNESLEEDDEQQ
ncbi:MAG: SPOR domain-containing protein [Thermodesulfobacteriales bacterium]